MKRVISIALLLIFVAGQINLTFAEHFCMSFKIKSSVMVGHGDLDCGMGEMMACDDEESTANGPLLKAPSCCSNDYYSSDSDDHFNKSEPISGNELLFVAAFVESFLNIDPTNDEQYAVVASSPPLIQQDRQILYQTFLL